jgi:hypothetical protein
MRVKTFFRMLRIIAAVTLFFFSWSFGPIYAAVAYAAESKQKAQSADPSQSPLAKGGSRGVGQASGDRFEKALEAIREKIGKADEKTSKNQDITTEVAEVKKQRVEIEKLDVELKKEFTATEKKLKDAKLPQEILDRHAKFVKHYEDNLKELKTNLDDIEKLKADSRQLRAALTKAKAHLEKTKAPSKHIPLDPNNLPNRMVKAKARAPRLKKEEFEKDFPPQKKTIKLASLQATSAANNREWTQILNSAFRNPNSALSGKPILVAANGSLAGLLSSGSKLPRPLGESIASAPECSYRGVRGGFDSAPFAINDFAPNTEPNTPNYQVALASPNAPTADDLAETPDVQFTDAIRAKAIELGNNPVKIYEYVRNNIEYAPTYGSIQGADQCLQSKICNDMDTASLLVALLRVSGIYAHYVYGTIQIPIDKAMNWVGGVTDSKMAGTILTTNGIPAKMLVSGGTYKAVQLEHVWVSAFIDYIPSRGAVHRQGDTFIPLDASYKQYNYTQGIDIASTVPFDAQSFANQLLSTATTNTVDCSVTNVNSALVQQTMQDYQSQVQNYIQQNHPNATVGDMIGKKEIINQEFGILPETLPYKAIQVGSKFAQVPENLRETISFSIPDPTSISAGVTYSTDMPQIAGKKITLSFSPASANDQAVIESLLPAPHEDGTPIQPSELPTSFPAYLINLKPELRIDGQIVTSGSAGTMGSALSFTMSLNEPGIGLSNIENIIKSGEYFGIGVDTGRIGTKRLVDIKSKLESTLANLSAHNYSSVTRDNIVGDALSTTIAAYFAELDVTDEVLAKKMGIIRYRLRLYVFSFLRSIGIRNADECECKRLDDGRG